MFMVILVVFYSVLVGFDNVFDIVLVVRGSGCFGQCRSFFYNEISEILLRLGSILVANLLKFCFARF